MSNSGLCPTRADAEKKVDPNFEGSIMESLGFDKELCPTCNANLKSGICLNACHLSYDSQQRFFKAIGAIAKFKEKK